MTTYNGEQYLQRQMDTILEQLGSEDELIISDDGSMDKTQHIIKAYQDSRIRLLEHAFFGSPVLNMEYALKEAIGDVVFLADQDDVWLPGRVEKTLVKMNDYDLVVCNAQIVDQDEQVIHESYFRWKGSRKGFWKNLRKNAYLGCAMAFNRKILNAVLPFPKNLIMHDVWIGLMAEKTGSVCFLDEKLIRYRRHHKNVTASIDRDDAHLSDFSIAYKIKYRLILIGQILKRYLRIRYL